MKQHPRLFRQLTKVVAFHPKVPAEVAEAPSELLQLDCLGLFVCFFFSFKVSLEILGKFPRTGRKVKVQTGIISRTR